MGAFFIMCILIILDVKKIIYIIFLISLTLAGTTGKLRGLVYDSETREPLIGCNVIISEISLGTATDINGNFLIMDISPGIYTLNITMIGYSDYIVEDLSINSDLSTTLNIPMEVSAIEGTTVVVSEDQNKINKNLTSTTAIITSENIEQLPISEISDIVNIQAGFVDGHLRGGRSGEIAYWVDGIPVTDQYDGNTVVDVSKDMIQEMQLISGAFNAEYGQAMSGVLNIVTKEGTEDFGGSVDVYSGDFLSPSNDIFMNIDSFSPTTTKNIAMNFHGKIFENMYYYLNVRNIYYQGVYQGRKLYNPESYGVIMNDLSGEDVFHILGSDAYLDSVLNIQTMESRLMDTSDELFVSEMYDSLAQAHANPIGDGSYVPMDWNEKRYVQLNTIWKINNKTKLKFSIINDDVEYQEYDRMYKYNPDGNLIRNRIGLTTLLQVKQILNENSFFTIGLTNFSKEYEHSAFNNLGLYVHDQLDDLIDGYSFYVGGSNNSKFKRSTDTQTLKFDYTNQVNSSNMIKLGFEARNHSIFYQDIYLQPPLDMINIDPIYQSPYLIAPRIMPDSTIFYSEYEFSPIEYSMYIQDKIELDELIVNAGIRFDYFNSNGKILSDPSDPSIYNPIKPDNRYHDDNSNGIQDEGESNVSLSERMSYWYSTSSPKIMISPRFGASFPFSDRGVIHFSYGHFFQIPRFELLFHNSDFDLSQGTGNVGIVGNADLNPEKTVSYELGFKYQLNNFSTLDATFYCRDIRDLTGTRTEEISIFGGASTYSKYENSDFGFVKGLVLSMNYFNLDGFSANINYTLQQAKGTASDPSQAWSSSQGGLLAETYMIPLNWDQLHTLSMVLGYNQSDYGLSLIGKIGSGLPYTPLSSTNISTLIQNSESKPITSTVDFRAYYMLQVGEQKAQLYISILNLLNQLNHTNIYNDSGVADYTTYELDAIEQNTGEYINSIQEWFNNETYYSNPRRIEMGIRYDF